MSLETIEATAVKDVDSVLTQLATDLDKVRAFTDKINASVQKLQGDFVIKVAEKFPEVQPVVTLIVDITQGFDALIDALDDVSDGLRSVNAKTLPQAATGPGGSVPV
jgi:uncharacterized protein YoxC